MQQKRSSLFSHSLSINKSIARKNGGRKDPSTSEQSDDCCSWTIRMQARQDCNPVGADYNREYLLAALCNIPLQQSALYVTDGTFYTYKLPLKQPQGILVEIK